MKLKGKETFQASAQQIWDILMDKDKLAAVTPGVTELKETGHSQYEAIADIDIGPVKGKFKGNLEMLDKIPPYDVTLKAKQLSKIGNADVTINLSLAEENDNECTLAFSGQAKMSGVLARMGQRVMTGVASTITKQFFTALREELKQ